VQEGDCVFLVDVDLARGPRKPTGIAVLNADGWLQDIATAVQNDRIVDDIALYFVRRLTWLVAYTTPTVTVAGTTHRRSA
jgi:hypothetical protein